MYIKVKIEQTSIKSSFWNWRCLIPSLSVNIYDRSAAAYEVGFSRFGLRRTSKIDIIASTAQQPAIM